MTDFDDFRTAQDVHSALLIQGETIGLATVYRRLQTMAQTGEVDAIRTADGALAYRNCQAADHHHHLICRGCGKTQEVALHGVEQMLSDAAAEYSFHELDHEIELFGLCADCY